MRVGAREAKAGITFGVSAPPPPAAPPPTPEPAPPKARRALVHCSYAWGRFDITAASGAAMPQNPGVSGVNIINHGRPLALSGEIVSLQVVLSADIGASSRSYSVEVYLNRSDGAGGYAGWATTGIVATITGGSGTELYAENLSGGVGFSGGDLLACYDSKTGTPAAVSAWVEVGVTWVEEG